MHGAAAEGRREAFRGRLQHFRRLGIPRGLNPGKGKRIAYGEDQVLELALCTELSQFGLDPKMIADFMRSHWDDVLLKIKSQRYPKRDYDLLFVFTPRFMTASWAKEEPIEYEWYVTGAHVPKKERPAERWLKALERGCAINISKMMERLDLEAISASLGEWEDDRGVGP
jgi:hypothetical protein